MFFLCSNFASFSRAHDNFRIDEKCHLMTTNDERRQLLEPMTSYTNQKEKEQKSNWHWRASWWLLPIERRSVDGEINNYLRRQASALFHFRLQYTTWSASKNEGNCVDELFSDAVNCENRFSRDAKCSTTDKSISSTEPMNRNDKSIDNCDCDHWIIKNDKIFIRNFSFAKWIINWKTNCLLDFFFLIREFQSSKSTTQRGSNELYEWPLNVFFIVQFYCARVLLHWIQNKQ